MRPTDIVTQVETVQPGMYLAAATAAFGLVSTENVWVEANPKDTFALRMRGAAYLDKKELDKALRDFDACIALNPADA